MLSVVFRIGIAAMIVGWSAAEAEIALLHVNALANPATADGLTWDTAYPDLRDALATANTGEIWVAAGVYHPADVGGSRAASFVFPNGVAVYGGFAGTERTREERNPVLHETILCGDLGGNDDAGTVSDNSNRVVTAVNALSSANLLDGFTIRGGQADFSPTRTTGAGIYVENARLTIVNCVFKNNFASNNGGALHVKSGDLGGTVLAVENSIFEHNGSYGFGAALYSAANANGTQYPAVSLTGCTFRQNAFQYAVSSASTALTLSRCYFADNLGGALSANDRVTLHASNCVLMRNGGMSGSFYLGTRSTATLLHCTLAENYASEVRIVPDTFLKTALRIDNSILWNTASAVLDINETTSVNADIAVSQTLIAGGYPGNGNLDEAPSFRRTHPFGQLNWDSPARDYCSESTLVEDIEGALRPQNTAFDAGAWEFGLDSDGGGLPDRYEQEFGMNPLDGTDDQGDLDGDGLDNLEEFRRGTPPNDPAGPPDTYHVSKAGSDETGDGSELAPWKSISHALYYSEEATATFPVTIQVDEGVYEEAVRLRPYVTLAGAGQEATIIQHYNPADSESIVVDGAENAGLQDCTVTFPGSVTNVAVLLRIVDKPMRVERVIFDGKDQLYSNGTQFFNISQSSTLIKSCTFKRMQYGVQSADAAPVITRCFFQNIRDDAIFIREPASSNKETPITPNLGSIEDESTGLNWFENIGGKFIDNNSAGSARAQMNYYGEGYTQEAPIGDKVSGAVQYVPFVGKSPAPGGIFCALWDGASSAKTPVATAAVTLMPLNMTVTDNTTGVYTFSAVGGGAYTVIANAPAYYSASRAITVNEGDVTALSIPLAPKPAEGEGEPPVQKVPNVVGMLRAAAAEAILGAGYVLGVVSEQYDPVIAVNVVISQTPQADAVAPPGAAVAITVSLGPAAAETVYVPNLVGLDRAAAASLLKDLGLVLGTVSEQHHPTIPSGQVVSQTPDAGTQVPAGGAVSITMSLGPLPEEKPLDEVARTLASQFDAADVNQDGALDLLEARALFPYLTEEQFQELDANQDGRLTKDELDAFLDAPQCGCNGCSGEKRVGYWKKHLADWMLTGLCLAIILAKIR